MRRRRRLIALALRIRAVVFVTFIVITIAHLTAAPVDAQEPAQPQATAAAQLQAAIDKLGDLDYDRRTNASRIVRRTAPAQAVPALIRAVSEHADGYVRYRALVLLAGFNDPRAVDIMRESLASPNDRLRAVAYNYFEQHPDRAITTTLVAAMEKESSEFVRPALVRALAASVAVNDDPRVRETLVREAGRGQDFFRSAVIEALGDYKAKYAVDALMAIGRLDGPLQDDTAIALGKIGDRRALEVLAAMQRTAGREGQPYAAAGICLLGVNCSTHEGFLVETLRFADKNLGFQPLLRAAVAGLTAVAVAAPESSVRERALDALFEIGLPSRDPTRSPVALALATVALRQTDLVLARLLAHPARANAIALVGEGFDMLEEDFEKERFFMTVRRTYWGAAAGTPIRELTQQLIGKLDF